MKRPGVWPWFVILATAGCAQAPERERTTYTFESGRTPYSAAICIARNAKRMPNVTAEERLLGASAWEVIVRASGGSEETLAMAEARNRGTGSFVSLRVRSAPDGDPEAFAHSLMTDCQARMVAPSKR